MPILSGRTFTDHDDVTAPRIVVVNQEFVHRYFQDLDPIGKQIQLDIPAPRWSGARSSVWSAMCEITRKIPT